MKEAKGSAINCVLVQSVFFWAVFLIFHFKSI